MRKIRIGVISLIAVVILIAFTCTVYADTGVPAVPEIQGLTTGTSSNVVGTVTETDSGAWTLTNDPLTLYTVTDPAGYDILTQMTRDQAYAALDQLKSAGGSAVYTDTGSSIIVTQLSIPQSLLNQPVVGIDGTTWQQALDLVPPGVLTGPAISQNGIHSGVLDAGQVQYTAGYNSQYSGVSGQQTFAKSMALSTADTLADQSNIKANTNIQFIAVDTGRATNSEDVLLDGASQAQNSSSLILCPFANANPGIIPAFCNIEQAGSAFDTTLTSTVTSADTRFVGTDATIPTVLNYNINSEGITLGNQSSPMIGSVSAYLKVHVQEARNESTITGSILDPFDDGGSLYYSFPNAVSPMKSEDLVYSETSTASGLISKFSKSMSYSSQASAVQAPTSVIPLPFEGT
ncbi:MAG TPA: hypothetical protein VMC42_04645 [Methanoregulaceae archaeon]|nr:hypothetical protein [Methanoregulaceae archaeon]